MARLTTEEESNQAAVLMKELQYLEVKQLHLKVNDNSATQKSLQEEVNALRSATSRLNAEADILRSRLGEPAGMGGGGISKDDA